MHNLIKKMYCEILFDCMKMKDNIAFFVILHKYYGGSDFSVSDMIMEYYTGHKQK